MKSLLLVVMIGVMCLAGCSDPKAPIAPVDNGAPPAKDSGAGVGADGKKGPRIPVGPK